MKLSAKNLLRTLSKMTGRKWSDIAQYPKWPLYGRGDVNSQWAFWGSLTVAFLIKSWTLRKTPASNINGHNKPLTENCA